jgi:hypothetical protein
MVARTAARSRPRRRRRRRLRWLAVALLIVAAIVVYAQLTGSDDSWRALRGPIPFGEGRCAVALSPDRTVERTVCVVGSSTTCYDGRRQLAAARDDCRGARAVLVAEGLLPDAQAGS